MEIRIDKGICYQLKYSLFGDTTNRTASVLMRLSEWEISRMVIKKEAIKLSLDDNAKRTMLVRSFYMHSSMMQS